MRAAGQPPVRTTAQQQKWVEAYEPEESTCSWGFEWRDWRSEPHRQALLGFDGKAQLLPRSLLPQASCRRWLPQAAALRGPLPPLAASCMGKQHTAWSAARWRQHQGMQRWRRKSSGSTLHPPRTSC